MAIESMALIVGDRIGDALTALPLINSLANRYPEAEITLVFQRDGPGKDILMQNLDVREITLNVDHRIKARDLPKILKLLRIWPHKKFDVLADVFPSTPRKARLVKVLRAKRKIGIRWFLNEKFLRSNGHIYDVIVDGRKKKGIEINRGIFKAVTGSDNGYDIAYDFNLGKTKKRENSVAIFLGQGDIDRCWNLKNWKSLLEMIHKKYPAITFVSVGSRNEKRLTGELKKALEAKIEDCTGRMDVYESMKLLKSCDMLIGTDGGPVHMAGINNVPAIVVMGSPAEQWESFPSITYIRDKRDHKNCWGKGRCIFGNDKKGCADFIEPARVFRVFCKRQKRIFEKNNLK